MAEVWPFLPLPEIGERLSWLTAVHERRDDTSRWTLRDPRQTWTLRHAAESARADEMRWLFRSNTLGEWYVPVWVDATRVAVSSGDTAIACNTSAHYEAGGQAIVWASCDSYAVRTVGEVTDTGITLTAPAGITAAALVMPLQTCLAREGLKMTRTAREFWDAEAVFERSTGIGATTAATAVQVLFSIDCSDSMLGELTAAIAGVNLTLDYLEGTGLPHDVRVVAWGDVGTGIERMACDAADYDALRAFVSGLVADMGGSDYIEAFNGATAFFDQSKPQQMFIITDGVASNPTAAANLRDAVPGLLVHGLVLAGNSPTTLNEIDNTGGSEVWDGSALQLSSLLTVSSSVTSGASQTYAGDIYFPCAGVVVEPLAGRVFQAATYVDSGLGLVAVEPDRSFVEDLYEASIRESGQDAVWAMRQVLHAIRGQDAPFWLPVWGAPILGSTTTTIDIAPGRADPSDWAGEHIDAGGQARAVTGASLTGGHTRLTVGAMAGAPTGRVRLLRLVRGRSDEVEIRHHRVARWAEAKLTVGTP